MPARLRVCAQVNLLTYEVDALRTLMLSGVVSVHGFVPDLGVLIGALTLLVVIGAALYPRIAS